MIMDTAKWCTVVVLNHFLHLAGDAAQDLRCNHPRSHSHAGGRSVPSFFWPAPISAFIFITQSLKPAIGGTMVSPFFIIFFSFSLSKWVAVTDADIMFLQEAHLIRSFFLGDGCDDD
jgi:hypothetical protein